VFAGFPALRVALNEPDESAQKKSRETRVSRLIA